MDDRELILGQYKVYSDAKESFINRHFATNRFYFVFSFALLAVIYLFYALAPAILPPLFTAIFGIAVSVLWWMNIDSYQVLIKVKYANVLEYLETKLPEQPFHKEYIETQKMKKDKKYIFTNIQKSFACLSFCAFSVIFFSLILWGIKQQGAVVWF